MPRILGFYTPEALNALYLCEIVGADATFKSTPKLFYQIWIIHGKFRGRFVPLIYFLLPNKSEETYKRAIRHIPWLSDKLPRVVLLDFEMAEQNAFLQILGPTITIRLCSFHFSKAVLHWICTNGMKKDYDGNIDNFTDIVCQMIALKFVAMKYVETDEDEEMSHQVMDYFLAWKTEVYRLLPSKHLFLNEFTNYLESTYIGRRDPLAKRWETTPRYPHHQWNQFDATIAYEPRTTNYLEAFHRGFRTSMAVDHPPMSRFLQRLQAEAEFADKLMKIANEGVKVRSREHNQEKKENELNRMLNLKDVPPLEYLRMVSAKLAL